MIKLLNKPYYVFRPSQLVRRLAGGAPESVNLPWGPSIRVNPAEDIGHALATTGVYDLAVSEALWRLTEPGDVALDVGANIGYMSALLSARAARVVAFEPHPQLFERLSANVKGWKGDIEVHQLALSDESGEECLCIPDEFERNEGLAFISRSDGARRHIKVRAARLSDLKVDGVGIAKIDVEGRELNVLRGAGRLIGRIRDVVFEEHGTHPTPATLYLQERGYQLFYLARTMFGPTLTSVRHTPQARDPYAPQNCLATLDADRARKRMKPRGWRVLRAASE